MEPLRGDETTVGETTVVARGCRLDDAPVRAVLETDARPRFFWAAGTESIAARGSAATVTADGQSRFDDVRTALEALFDDCSVPDDLPSAARPRAFGGFTFHN